MPEIRIPAGPIESEPLHAIARAPGETGSDAATAALLDALDGAELGAYDHAIIDWLADTPLSAVATVCSWLHRVREAGRG